MKCKYLFVYKTRQLFLSILIRIFLMNKCVFYYNVWHYIVYVCTYVGIIYCLCVCRMSIVYIQYDCIQNMAMSCPHTVSDIIIWLTIFIIARAIWCISDNPLLIKKVSGQYLQCIHVYSRGKQTKNFKIIDKIWSGRKLSYSHKKNLNFNFW